MSLLGTDAAAPSFDIAGIEIGVGYPRYIIAEVGVNHNGSVDLACRLVDIAKRCGADCVKFQSFRAESLVTRKSPKAPYQLGTTDPAESHFDMLKKLELSIEEHVAVMSRCREVGITFLSTPYGPDDADMLDRLGVPAFKVASGQIVELPFLRHLARKRKPILLSTGMCTLGDVEEAVAAIRGEGNHEIVLLQCTTNYPSAYEDANLRAITTMRQAFALPVGYSDHTVGPAAVIAAVALDAVVIEKHLTLDRSLPGPDHSSSFEPDEFQRMVDSVRHAEVALGSGVKAPSASERSNIAAMRRSLVTQVDIRKGERVTEGMLTFKRPAYGLPPKWLPRVLGRRAARDIPAETQLSLDSIAWEDEAR